MKIKTIFILFTSILLVSLCLGQTAKVSWSSFNMGYGELKGGNTTIQSVVGQSLVGITHADNTQVISGFLADTLFGGTIVDVKNVAELPSRFSLDQNYPNPFNPSTTIHFELPKESHITLKVFNMLGQEVVTVLDEQKTAGRYDVRIDGSSLSSGVYFYRLKANSAEGEFIQTKKIIMVK